ncbi:MAG: energy transducer TonB [Verrucomicrobiota bacterium]
MPLLFAAALSVGCQMQTMTGAGCVFPVYGVPLVTLGEVEATSDSPGRGYPVAQYPLPIFPVEMVHAGIKGDVTVQIHVGADGAVRNAAIMSSPYVAFDRPVLQAVEKWRFFEYLDPGATERKGMTVRCRIHFQFDENATTPMAGLLMAGSER